MKNRGKNRKSWPKASKTLNPAFVKCAYQLSKAREAGLRDSLTRLHNRRHFDTALRAEMDTALKNDLPFCLIMVDVDHFKRVNDTYGHPAGDAVLRILGQLLAENVKGRDIPVRYGGEEFAIILPDTALSGAKTLANEIRRQLERKKLSLRDTGEDLGRITASFGVSELRNDDSPIDTNRPCRQVSLSGQEKRDGTG